MTKQESFKRRIRLRMATTGERYAEARRVLIEKSQAVSGGRTWVSQPEMSNDAVREATGKGWNEWCTLIENWPGHTDGHPAIAAYLEAEQHLDGWWSQSVTGGFERITGLRLPHQMPDGTFTANKSRTALVDVRLLREMLLDDEQRGDLFPGVTTELRSKPASKAIRLLVGPGVALLSLTPVGDDRAKITVQHAKLPTFDDVEQWKFYWSDWLDALDDDVGAS